jgi:dephospho-CoA kinase
MSFVVGLTGGIGSGKSTVADRFAALGAAIVDTDVISRELTAENGAAMPEISADFGPDVVLANGALNRAAMRRLVFSDGSAKGRLEAILHPLIRRVSEARCAAATTAPYIILVVPLLLESGAYRTQVQRILVVDCEEETQVSRVVARSGLTHDEARAIMAAQASRAQRLAAADDVILNTGDRAGLDSQIQLFDQRYRALAASL